MLFKDAIPEFLDYLIVELTAHRRQKMAIKKI